MERIVFVIPNMSGGGAARVASLLLPQWLGAGHQVHLVTFEEAGATSAYALDPGIVRHQLGLHASPPGAVGMLTTNLARVRRLRRLFREIAPTAVISFLLDANVAVVLASWRLGMPVLISERNHPAHDAAPAFKALARRIVYPWAGRLCVQTGDIRAWFAGNLGIEAGVVPNPVALPAPTPASGRVAGVAGARPRRVVSLGRLEPQKGFDRLLSAFASIADNVPDWELVIFGEGGQRTALEAQVASLGLAGRVRLPGATAAPLEELARADLYVHPARFEGYPNAVLEALACSLCVVATDCPGATGEILKGGAYGLLVPDGDGPAFAAAMLKAMSDDALRSQYARAARDAVSELSPASIARRWLDEIARVRSAAAPARAVKGEAITPSRLR